MNAPAIQTPARGVAVVGGGVSGIAAACGLGGKLAALYEKEERPGGHAKTAEVEHEGDKRAVDVAFMVYNRRNYPVFCEMLRQAGVAGRATAMSFSVYHEEMRLQYNGGSLAGLFAEPRNMLRGKFCRMLADILRFNRAARKDILAQKLDDEETIGEYAKRQGCGDAFAAAYLLPMGASIWSCGREDFARAPAKFALPFFYNHGLLALWGRPQWMSIAGGSRRYVDSLLARLPAGALRCNEPAQKIWTEAGGVVVESAGGARKFAAAVVAAHAPDALQLLSPPSEEERQTLAAFRYAQSAAVLHTDVALLPPRRRAWAAWNYRVFAGGEAAATYHLSMLQHLPGKTPLLLSLNDGARRVDPAKVVAKFNFAHPLPSAAAMRARGRAAKINGKRGLYFCGAYWGNGFHEDGAASGAACARAALAAA